MKKKIARKSSFVIGCMLISVFLIACGDKKELTENLPEGQINDAQQETENLPDVESEDIAENEAVLPEGVTAYADSEDIYFVGDGNYFGYIAKDGTAITGFIYDKAYPFSDGLAAVLKDGKCGFIDTTGNIAISMVYDDLAPFSDGLAYFAKEDTYGFLDTEGNVAFYLDCDSVSSFQEGMAYYSEDGKYGYINTAGECVILAEYSDADYFQEGLAFIAVDGNKGAINAKGKIVIPMQYDKIERVENAYICAKTKEVCDYYSLSGQAISQEEAERRYEEATSQETYSNLSNIMLKNSITPKNEEYYKIAQEEPYFMEWKEFYIVNAKFYDIDYSGNPVLYFYTEPINQLGFPMSSSAFYFYKNGSMEILLSDEECGGSARGGYVCLFKDLETGQLKLSIDGMAGGFAGWATYSNIYDYMDGSVSEIVSYDWIEQSSANYEEEELLKDAQLFYDEEGNTFTQDTILDAYYVTEYRVNNVRVTKEEYDSTTEKYQYYTLY